MPEVAVTMRIVTLTAVLARRSEQKAVADALRAANGDFNAAYSKLKTKLPPDVLRVVSLGHALADWCGDNVPIVKALVAQPDIINLRDVALRFDVDKLTPLVDPNIVPDTVAGSTPAEKQRNFAVSLHNKLFLTQTSAVLQRMALDAELPIADPAVRSNVATFLANVPDFNIRTTSIYTALQKPDALKGIPDARQPDVVAQLKILARVQALTNVPDAVPVLMEANLTSAFQVAEMPESTFLAAHGATLGGEEVARHVYTNALNNRIRNEHALMTMRESVRGSGLAIIDGQDSKEMRMARMQKVADDKGVQLNLESLFGGTDYCECDDCLSVYSPASYFVEILQYLRNNDLDPKNTHTAQKGIAGTPLEKLFRRRPDLGCLELTCENTFTVLPYVDLVNEVMESFVVHIGDYHADTNDPKQAKLEVFNVEDETSSELLAQPQHINYDAYGILKSAVYPFTLPYHQPIDAIRIFLKFLGTSRYELLDTYRSAHEPGVVESTTLTPAEKLDLQTLHETILTRAVDAEFLGLTQEEYIILTKEAFWPKHYFEIILKQPAIADQDYRDNVGVNPVCQYYGYTADADMLSTDEDPATGQKGLTFVKKQFLPRTGVLYVDLVELLKTRFINPNYPRGSAYTVLESIRSSYRFLQTLVNVRSTDPDTRFGKLIEFLNEAQPLVPKLDALLHPDPCRQQDPSQRLEREDLRQWVGCYFERIGKLIVLESGQGAKLIVQFQEVATDLEGELYTPDKHQVGYLRKDGIIFDAARTILIGQVGSDFAVTWADDKSFVEKFGNAIGAIVVVNNIGGKDTQIGAITTDGIWGPYVGRMRPIWTETRDTCDLDNVRLTHLDGTPLADAEYDRMHRFIRLWRKLGWTIGQTDEALAGQATGAGGAGAGGAAVGGAADGVHFVGYRAFKDDTNIRDEGRPRFIRATRRLDWPCPDLKDASGDINPDFLHQLAAILKLLDQTGLPLEKLLTFWADIGTAGEKSLYSRLFLTHNLIAIDNVLQADKNGDYLTQVAPISNHLPVLMAALRVKADDITTIMQFRSIADALTLSNVSVLYRHSLLAKLLHVKIADLADVIGLFGDPFPSPQATLDLLETWGKMEDAGFTFRQLNYLIQDRDDPLRPLAPSQKTVLKTAKTLYDGLNGIDRDHPDIPDAHPPQATDDLIRTKAGLLFEQTVVEQIVGLLDGTTVLTIGAPANQTITIPTSLAGKLKYANQKDANPPQAAIQVTGIFTNAEATLAKSLSNLPAWSKAIDWVGKLALNFFNDVLFGIFPDTNAATQTLLAGDVSVPSDPQDPANTAPRKRLYFLKYFLPFLRQRLSHRLMVGALSGVSGLANDICDSLLSDILLVGSTKQHAIDALEQIKNKPAGSPTGWKGYLIPSVDGAYTFIAVSDAQPAPLVLDGQTIPFVVQQDDPSNVFWSTDLAIPTKLKAGKLYWLEVDGQSADELLWKTASSPKAKIPSADLLPDYSAQGVGEAVTKLIKCALVVNGFLLTVDEVSYWQAHAADFDGFDFNAVTLQHWKRLQAYTHLRNNLPKTETTLLNLFQWATHPDKPATLSEKIAAATVWKKENIDKLLTVEHFDLNDPTDFRNEVALAKLRDAIEMAARIGIDIDPLFDWAKPGSKFSECHLIAESIRQAIHAKFTEDDWEQVVKPLNDQLREDQKQALISYLLVQQDLIQWGVIDADSLFEFFLIDVQMCACMDTSRIKQAVSSVQLFVQRCMLGLEAPYGVPSDALDRDRWDWMQKYRLWEANRKVFLYPENWIRPELRDDKSPFYKELESELLQKDIQAETIEDALKGYLFKVDEVANLKVVGLFLEQDIDNDGSLTVDSTGNPLYVKLHVFGRTRNVPSFFYYRYYQLTDNTWHPWEKMQVDIPSYDVEDADGQIQERGTYLTPVVWNRRLFVFFPQFVKKTQPATLTIKVDGGQERTPTTKEMSEMPFGNSGPSEFWEVKLAWSEYRNKKWVQKQVSKDALYHFVTTKGVDSITADGHTTTYTRSGRLLSPIQSYQIVPRVMTNTAQEIVIDLYNAHVAVGAFHFQGSQITGVGNTGIPAFPGASTDFHYDGTQIHSLQAANTASPSLVSSEPYVDDPPTSDVVINVDGSPITFLHPFVHDLLGQLTAGGLDTLFGYYLSKIPDDSGTIPHKIDAFGGAAQPMIYHELKRAYSLYNWEAAFHAPMQLVDRLLIAQQFDQALKMVHYVLDPSAKGTDARRFWQFFPFKEIDASSALENLFLGLQPNQANDYINEWRSKPFQPHVIARARPSAYMKYVAMKYIELLIAYGDYYFRQFTLETIPLAIQCYVLAAHVYGPRGQKIPKRGKVQAETYSALMDRWDAFGNAMVELELVFPFSNQTALSMGVSNGVVGLANIFGFATTLYFCIPDNPQLSTLRDTIDDRLFKIRHCQDIEGVERKLPLFEAPIDPGLLVQAAAQGLSLSSVLNDLNSPMPNYRFVYLLQKALELCTEVKTLGNAFLSAKEKGDAEALSQLRAKHESGIYNLVMEVKKLQLDESQKSLEALQQSRLGPVSRMQYYLKLIGQDLGKVPDADAEFGELPNQIEAPVDESGLKLIGFEKEEMDKASAAADWQIGVGVAETLASVFHALPTLTAAGHPLGVGADVLWGFPNLANATQAVARGLKIYGDQLSYHSSSAARKAGFLRQLQDRVQQANTAGYEIKHIDKQILAQQIRINLANQEITNQQLQIDNAQEIEDFLRDKYTSQDLYSWMEGQVRGLYYQAYTLAYDLAKRAEKVFRFERGLDTSNFIQFGYWDAAYDGLLAGERLHIGLKQLEAAYQERRGYDFEISAPFSLRQINPWALIQLKETGGCEFSLPEVLFDLSRPGDYMRRIKSVALTIPCVVGPYTGLNCTLRLLEHKFRTSAIVKDKSDYPETTDETDDRFSTVNLPIASIATSTGQSDSGVFELNFRDERYLPFEGAGAISKWRLELPAALPQFDYDSITDVIIQLRYTAVDGGNKLNQAASGFVKQFISSVEELSQDEGLFAAFDLRHDFPNEWYKASQVAAGAAGRVIAIDNLVDRLPIFTQGKAAGKIQATDVYLFTPSGLTAASLMITTNLGDYPFSDGPKVGTLNTFVVHGVASSLLGWQLKIADTTTALDKVWMVVRYVLSV